MVGWPVGISVGAFVGAEDGLCVGAGVGGAVGSVGAGVGISVGDGVGSFVGVGVGEAVGVFVGVGGLVGTVGVPEVGAIDGWTVGAPIIEPVVASHDWCGCRISMNVIIPISSWGNRWPIELKNKMKR